MLGAAAVTLGAFGAHALKARLGADALSLWQTAVQYHFWHALALGAPRWLGMVAPVGGVALILGWLAFAGAAIRS